uniref:Uncharacterized protein n=1 Tax=Setaria viridis TaxID=4556 RepID=A0A4U6T6V3_SETVI|nr:hypothetical protein SEVIR_9G175650v2 [Setaria viridis]
MDRLNSQFILPMACSVFYLLVVPYCTRSLSSLVFSARLQVFY